jgi:hypothetical protein
MDWIVAWPAHVHQMRTPRIGRDVRPARVTRRWFRRRNRARAGYTRMVGGHRVDVDGDRPVKTAFWHDHGKSSCKEMDGGRLSLLTSRVPTVHLFYVTTMSSVELYNATMWYGGKSPVSSVFIYCN